MSIGDRLERDFGVYAALPVSAKEATAQGWYPMQTKCSPGLGVPYAQVTHDSSPARANCSFGWQVGRAPPSRNPARRCVGNFEICAN